MSACRSVLSGLVLSAVVLTGLSAPASTAQRPTAVQAPLLAPSTLAMVPGVSNASARGAVSEVVVPAIRIYVDPVYTGQATEALLAMSDKISAFVTEHPTTFSSGYFSADSSKFYVGVARPGDAAAAEFEELASSLDPGRKLVVTAPARRSWSELSAVKDTVYEDHMVSPEAMVQAVGVDTSRNAVVVHVLRRAADGPLESLPEVAEIAGRFADIVMFRDLPGPISVTSSNDVTPHFADAGYWWLDGGGNLVSDPCSLAFPIRYNNVTYGLIAGHCRPGSATNYVSAYSTGGFDSSRYFGSLYTTSWPGNAWLYVDFALLQGSSYSPYVYNTSDLDSSSALPVRDAAFYFPAPHSSMCTSGNSTGQKCRYTVIDTNLCVNASGTQVCNVFRMRSDQNLDGLYDCNGAEVGDSGGGVYAARATGGGVIAYGIVTAATITCPSLGKDYWSTSLYGLRQWKSSVTMILA